MSDPGAFADAWRAQFSDTEPPPSMAPLRSVAEIQGELDRCKASIRRLETEVSKERFRMIYLQTLLAKERKSYDRQRWRPFGAKGDDGDDEEEAASANDAPEMPRNKNAAQIASAVTGAALSPCAKDATAAPEKPFYVNLEYHREKGLVKINDKEVSDHLSVLGSQAMQMDARKKRPVRGRSADVTAAAAFSYDGDYEDAELNPRFLRDNLLTDGNGSGRDFQPYQSVYVGGLMADGRNAAPPPLLRSCAIVESEKPSLTWPRRSYSPRGFEDGGGYTPDCSSNENLTSSEEDFSSGQSGRVSPSPTTTAGPPHLYGRKKTRSPSQNSQQSFDSSGGSPPTPQSQKRQRHPRRVTTAALEAAIGVRKLVQIWPPEGSGLQGDPGEDLLRSQTGRNAAHACANCAVPPSIIMILITIN
ncbi:breakpoint cluster region protein-like [Sceloporus undulatus]|uniref:breakpoint cluster region protein-like n=1 Tax=Sceloporus undulatus TaxID=8520 RepID=UPI001C4CFEE1|nr:breakpoint cluster region protein-like [Sceloporus undulatus]